MHSLKKWNRSDFIFHQQLGVGKFGVVYKATEKQTEKHVAIKVVLKKKITSDVLHKRLERQIEIHTRLSHPNICQMFGYFHDEHHVYMIMEYCQNGSLFAPVKIQKQKFTVKKIASILSQLASALGYLNQRNVIHRDMKLENILFDQDYNVKVTDFGCCVHTTKSRSTFCGTVEYLCPQMLEQQEYGSEIDYYCLGIVLYQLFYHVSPFYDKQEEQVLRKIKQRHISFPNDARQIPISARKLIEKLLLHNKNNMYAQILEHQFITDNLNP